MGFFSILLFGIVLSNAGVVIAAVMDDVLHRIGLRQLSWPSVSCLLWAAIYYLWMLVIAATIREWKWRRLEEDMSYADGYWFAYISTTTVGLGDFYLEPEVILPHDLIVFPLLFLNGFVYFAAFLSKFAEFCSGFISNNGKKTLMQSLKERFDHSPEDEENEIDSSSDKNKSSERTNSP